MENQQAKIEEIELAWLGGFFDGEGSLCMMRTNLGKFKVNGEPVGGFVPRMTICNTNFAILPTICGIAEQLGLPYHIYDNMDSKTRKSHNLPSWHFSVQGLKRMTRWLMIIFPYLKVKRPQAELLLEYSISRSKMRKNTPLTKRQKEIIDIFRNPQSPQRLNALKGSRKHYYSEWYSPSYGETRRVAQK